MPDPTVSIFDFTEINPTSEIAFDSPVGFISLVTDVTGSSSIQPLISPND